MLQVPTIVDTVALGWVSKLYLTICFRNVTFKQFDNQIKLVGVFTRRNLSFSQRAQTMKKSDTWFRFIIRNIYNLLILGGVIFSSYLVGKYTFERVVTVDSHLRLVKQMIGRLKETKYWEFCLLKNLLKSPQPYLWKFWKLEFSLIHIVLTWHYIASRSQFSSGLWVRMHLRSWT